MEADSDIISIGLKGELFHGSRAELRSIIGVMTNATDKDIIELCMANGFSPLFIRGVTVSLNDWAQPNQEILEIGDSVRCDTCSKEWRGTENTGGFLFQSKAVCPDCAPALEKSLINYGETRFIKGRCPADMSFWRWVLGLREGRHTVTITRG